MNLKTKPQSVSREYREIFRLDPEFSEDGAEYWRARFSWKRAARLAWMIAVHALALVGVLLVVLRAMGVK